MSHLTEAERKKLEECPMPLMAKAAYEAETGKDFYEYQEKTMNATQKALKNGRKKLVENGVPLRLDFGCGPNPRPGFEGVDIRPFDGKVKHVLNLVEKLNNYSRPEQVTYKPWPWADDSVTEAHASHFVEHLDAMERVHFCNELYRVLIPGGKATIVTPHWNSQRAYGDLTHKWPPISEFWFYYLSKDWRNGCSKECELCKGAGTGPVGACQACAGNGKIVMQANAPHNDFYTCDFHCGWGYSMHPQIVLKNAEGQQFAMSWYKEACQDIICTWGKK